MLEWVAEWRGMRMLKEGIIEILENFIPSAKEVIWSCSNEFMNACTK